IARDDDRPASFLFDNRLGFRRIIVFAQVRDGDVRAFAREQGGNCPPDAAVRAGDQRDLALQPVRTLVARFPVGLWLKLAFVTRQPVLADHRFDDIGHDAYSFGATPIPSFSNSALVAWLSFLGSSF